MRIVPYSFSFPICFACGLHTCLHPEELDGAIGVPYRERFAVGAPSNTRESAIAHVFLSQREASLPTHSPVYTNRGDSNSDRRLMMCWEKKQEMKHPQRCHVRLSTTLVTYFQLDRTLRF